MNSIEWVRPMLHTDGRGMFGHTNAPSFRQTEKPGVPWIFLQRKITKRERNISRQAKARFRWQILMPLLPGERIPARPGDEMPMGYGDCGVFHGLAESKGVKYHAVTGWADGALSEGERFALWKRYRNEQLLAHRAIKPGWVLALEKKLLNHFYPALNAGGEMKYHEWVALMCRHVHPSFLTRECEGFLNGQFAAIQLAAFLKAMKSERPRAHRNLSRDLFLWSHWLDLTEPGMTATKAHKLLQDTLGESVAGDVEAFQRYLRRNKIRLHPARRPQNKSDKSAKESIAVSC